MFTYCWTGVDLTTGKITISPNYYSLQSAKKSIARYLSDKDPDDYVFDIIRVDDRGYKTSVYPRSEIDLKEGPGPFTYYWMGSDWITGGIFRSPKHYPSLESVERSIESYIKKYLSDRDPEDYEFTVMKVDDRGHESLFYTKKKRDLGEGVDLEDWHRLLKLRRGGFVPSVDERKVDALLKRIKDDGTIESESSEELKLAKQTRTLDV